MVSLPFILLFISLFCDVENFCIFLTVLAARKRTATIIPSLSQLSKTEFNRKFLRFTLLLCTTLFPLAYMCHVLKTTLFFVNQEESTWSQCYLSCREQSYTALLVYISTTLRHYKGQNYAALNAIEYCCIFHVSVLCQILSRES